MPTRCARAVGGPPRGPAWLCDAPPVAPPFLAASADPSGCAGGRCLRALAQPGPAVLGLPPAPAATELLPPPLLEPPGTEASAPCRPGRLYRLRPGEGSGRPGRCSRPQPSAARFFPTYLWPPHLLGLQSVLQPGPPLPVWQPASGLWSHPLYARQLQSVCRGVGAGRPLEHQQLQQCEGGCALLDLAGWGWLQPQGGGGQRLAGRIGQPGARGSHQCPQCEPGDKPLHPTEVPRAQGFPTMALGRSWILLHHSRLLT